MANTKSAQKMVRSSERKRLRNRPVRSSVRTAVSKARHLIAAGSADAEAAVREAASALDRAAQKGVIHHNNAARNKSRLMKRLNLSAAAV